MAIAEIPKMVLESEAVLASDDELELEKVGTDWQYAEAAVLEGARSSIDPKIIRERRAYHYSTFTIQESLDALEHYAQKIEVDDMRTIFRDTLSYLAQLNDVETVADETFANWVERFHLTTEDEKIPAIDNGAIPAALNRL